MKIQALFLILVIASTCTATDWFKCAQAALSLVSDVYNLVQDVQSGFNVTKIVADLQAIITQIETTQTSCGLNETVVYQPEDMQACVGDVMTLYYDIKALQAAVEKKNVDLILIVSKKIYTEAQKTESDCGITIVQPEPQQLEDQNVDRNWPECGKDIQIILTNMELVRKQYTTSNQITTDTLEQLYEMYQALYNSQSDCQWTTQFTLPEVEIQDQQQCFDAVLKIEQTAISIEKDIKSFNAVQLEKDLALLYQEVQQAIQICEAQQEEQQQLKQKKIQDKVIGVNWYQCGQDVAVVVENVAKISQEAKDVQANLPEIIDQLEVIVNATLKAQTDCAYNQGFNFLDELPFEINQPGDYQQCVQAVLQLEQIAIQVEKDVKTFNIVQLAKDLQNLYNQTQFAIQVCENSTEITLPTVQINWENCLGDVLVIVTNVNKIVKEAKENIETNLPAIIVQLQAVLKTIGQATSDCSFATLDFQVQGFGDQQQCMQAIQQMETTAQQIGKDVKTFNIAALSTDLNTLYQQTQYALQACSSGNEMSN